MSKIEELERRIERIERQMFPQEHDPQPYMPIAIGPVHYQCVVCGIKREAGKSFGYVCPRADCPTAARAI